MTILLTAYITGAVFCLLSASVLDSIADGGE